MATIINADTTNGLKLTSDTSGEIELQSAGTTIATVDSTGLTMASGKLLASTGPAFSAFAEGLQPLSSETWTKISFPTEEFDTNSNFASSKFTPTVAGYYQVNSQLQPNEYYTGGAVSIYKNGIRFKSGNFAASTAFGGFVVSTLIYLNGSTDYIEVYGLFETGQIVAQGPSFSYFSAFLARAA